MAIFNVLKYMYHHLIMKRLYNSIFFFVLHTTTKNKVIFQVVTIKGICIIPPFVLQEVKRDDKISLCDKGKVCVLEKDTLFTYLVASIAYNNNPIHYLIMVCEELKWELDEDDVLNGDTRKTRTIFLRINIIHDCIMTMGSVDLEYQLLGN